MAHLREHIAGTLGFCVSAQAWPYTYCEQAVERYVADALSVHLAMHAERRAHARVSHHSDLIRAGKTTVDERQIRVQHTGVVHLRDRPHWRVARVRAHVNGGTDAEFAS